jgi:hypothetical protein
MIQWRKEEEDDHEFSFVGPAKKKRLPEGSLQRDL